MKIGILGTGVVSKTLAAKLDTLGHAIVLGTRDPAEARARSGKGNYGDAPLSELLAAQPGIGLGTFAEAAAHGEIVLNATSGDGSLAALQAAGAGNLDGKVLVDIANPLDFSRGFPPRLSVGNDDSLAEQIQRAFPGARVVKTLNTVNALLMVAPQALAGGDHTMFLCGDDAGAKDVARGLLSELGWTDVLDLGGLSNARGTEAWLLLWTRLYGALQKPMFSLKVVR